MAYGYEIFLKDGISSVANSIARNYNLMSGNILSANRQIDKSVEGIGTHFSGLSQKIGIDPSHIISQFHQIKDASIEAFAGIEKKSAILGNSFQSKSAASAVLKDIESFAQANNVSLKETEDSYMSLANRGFAPTMKELKGLTDIAIVSNKGINQLAEAILDAETQEFERLKEFGIKLEKGKNGIAATFKGMVTQIGSDSQSIRKYILGIGNMEGVAGVTDAVAKTASGGVIAIKNQYELLYRAIGEIAVPLNSVFGSIAMPILRKTTQFVKDHKRELLEVGSAIMYVGVRVLAVYGAFKVLHGGIIVFNALHGGLVSIYGGLRRVRSWILVNSIALQDMAIAGIRALIPMLTTIGGYVASLISATAAQFGLNIAMSANPVGLIVLGVAALIAMFYGLFKLVDTAFPNFFKSVTEGFKKAFQWVYEGFIKPVMDFFSWLFESAMPKLPEAVGVEKDKYAEWKYRSGEDSGSVYDFLNPSAGGKVGGKDDKKEKKKAGISDKIENSGHGGIKNITINIGKLVEQMHFHTHNMTENADKIKEQVIRLLLDATNQVNYQ